MPLYDYECRHCGNKEERFFKISERRDYVRCQCGEPMPRIITSHIERVEPTWLDDAVRNACVKASDVPIPRDRNEFNAYLKKNNIDHIG